MSKTRRQVTQSPPLYATASVWSAANGVHRLKGWLYLGCVYNDHGEAFDLSEGWAVNYHPNPPPMPRAVWLSIVVKIENEYIN